MLRLALALGCALPLGCQHPVRAGPGAPVVGKTAAAAPPAVHSLAGPPLHFEPNRGQLDGDARYLARAGGMRVQLAPDRATFELRPAADEPAGIAGVDMTWLGGASEPTLLAERPLPGHTSYAIGDDPSRWLRKLPHYGAVRYLDVYPGIDLVFYGNPRQLQYDLVVAPGADPARIALRFEGSDRLEIDAAGDLLVHAAGEVLRMRRPVVFQRDGEATTEVEGRFQLAGRDADRVAFEVGRYDAGRALVIDPRIVFSSYSGGTDYEIATDVTLDDEGFFYLTGESRFSEDAYVAKVAPTGDAFVYVFFFGGYQIQRFDGEDQGNAVVVDEDGYAYVGGQTNSLNFPVMNAYQAVNNPLGEGNNAGFVGKIEPDGSGFVWATYLGSERRDEVLDIALDSENQVHVTGVTSSLGFPTVNPAQSDCDPPEINVDAFVAKFTAAGNNLVYSTYLCGNSDTDDIGLGITVADDDRAYVTGWTRDANFVTTDGSSHNGDRDVFLAILGTTGTLDLSTLLGSGEMEWGEDLVLDEQGRVWITGTTRSTTFPPAVSGGASPVPQPACSLDMSGNCRDAYLVRVDLDGGVSISYGTYLGGGGSDAGHAVARSGAGHVYVVGQTFSDDFPLVGSNDPAFARKSDSDGFATVLDPATSTWVYSVFLGGTDFDESNGVAVDSVGNAVVVGETSSTDFPVLNALQPMNAGQQDDTWTKITMAEPGLLVGYGDGGEGFTEVFEDRPTFAPILLFQTAIPNYNVLDPNGGSTRPVWCNLDDDPGQEIVIGLGPDTGNPLVRGGMGELEIRDDAAMGFMLIQRITVGDLAYQALVGESFPACGDLDDDGRDEIVVGLGTNVAGEAWVFDDRLAGFAPLARTPFPGGVLRRAWTMWSDGGGAVHPAVGNLDLDDKEEIVLAFGTGGGGYVQVLDDMDHGLTPETGFGPFEGTGTNHGLLRFADGLGQFVLYNELNGEIWPAICDLNGDGIGEVVLGTGEGGAGYFQVLDANQGFAPIDGPSGTDTFLPNGFGKLDISPLYDQMNGTVHPACGDLDGDVYDELALGMGTFPGGAGGIVEIRDDVFEAFAPISQITLTRMAYVNANGLTRPAVRKRVPEAASARGGTPDEEADEGGGPVSGEGLGRGGSLSLAEQYRVLKQAARAAEARKVRSDLRHQLRGMEPSVRAVRSQQGTPAAEAFPATRVDAAGMVHVYLHVSALGPDEEAELAALGVEIELAHERLGLCQAWVPAAAIEDVAALPFVRRITPPDYGYSRIGSVTSEGVALHNADFFHGLGVDGDDVQVAVIAEGADDWQSAAATGDLPAQIFESGFCASQDPSSPGCNEGTAMLEIVHDMAPGAELGHCAATTSLEFIFCVEFDLALDPEFQPEVIVDDRGYFGEPYFEDGPVAGTVQEAVDRGVLFVSAAGNEAREHYEGGFVGSFALGFDDLLGRPIPEHDFGTAAEGEPDPTMDMLLPDDVTLTVDLQWNDPFGASDNDYDLLLVEITNQGVQNVLAASVDVQDGFEDDPVERIVYKNVTGQERVVKLVVLRNPGGDDRLLEMFIRTQRGDDTPPDAGFAREYIVEEGSIFGHPALPGVLAVGAFDPLVSFDLRPTSSVGPSEIFYPSAETRRKPDLVAVDDVSVTGAGGFPQLFPGTSAAAPHVAGAAAVLLGQSPLADRDDIVRELRRTALDLDEPGPDNRVGDGFLFLTLPEPAASLAQLCALACLGLLRAARRRRL